MDKDEQALLTLIYNNIVKKTTPVTLLNKILTLVIKNMYSIKKP